MITVVVGGQYGGEGKGKICAYLAHVRPYALSCRTGGVNSSHTVVWGGRTHRLRMLPAASAVNPNYRVVFGAGSLIHIPTLHAEMAELAVDPDRILIDPLAGVVTDECVAEQRRDPLYDSIGSTLTGTGYASARRCQRRLTLARECPELLCHLGDVSKILATAIREDQSILLEGHQGAGLSNYHGDYPFTSSRDCTTPALLSEVGLGVPANLQTILTLKIFPTRNHVGRLPNELSPLDAEAFGISERGGGSWGIPDRDRRVGLIDYDDLRRAVLLNSPHFLAVTGLDYFDRDSVGLTTREALPRRSRAFLDQLEEILAVPVGLVSVGPDVHATIVYSPELAETFDPLHQSASGASRRRSAGDQRDFI